jgi:dephospho-CoA kinase
MLKIGLTGGIGCGKSTAANLFAAYGVPVIDADTIAHRLVEPGSPALLKLRQCFGTEIIMSSGTLDRARLRELVFTDALKKKQLESIMHPLVYGEMQKLVDALNAGYAILVVPLLLETGKQDFVDRIAVVDCPEKQQIERVKERDGIPESTIAAIMRTQVSRQQRLTAADDIIDNSYGADLVQQIEKLHNLYLILSKS